MQARNDPECAYVLGGGVNPTGLRTSPQHCMDFAYNEYNAKGSLHWYRPQGNMDILHGMWCGTCCDCEPRETMFPAALPGALDEVVDGGRFVWVMGADGLHKGLDPTCARGYIKEMAEQLHKYMKEKRRNITIYTFMYGTPVGYPPLKKRYAPAYAVDGQSPENILKYNQDQLTFLAEMKAAFGDLIHGWIMLDPQGAVNAAFEIWDKLGWGPRRDGSDIDEKDAGDDWGADGAFLGRHFGSNDGTHAPHMANKANFNLFLNMASAMVETTESPKV